MTQLHFDAPINSLSFGNVSFNFLREFWKKGVEISLFPHGNSANFEAFDKADPELIEWIRQSAFNRYKALDKNKPTLKLWHLNGGEQRVAPKQFLYTFYECDSPTEEEVAVIKSQEHVFFSSSESCNHFKEKGCDNVSFVPIGFDTDFHKTNKKYLGDKVVHFGLIGKFEKRKNTQAIIQTWLSKYGNNPEFQLTCLINNPFFPEEDFKQIIHQTVGGKRWTNLNLLPSLKTNSEVNEVLNAIDIDLSGLSSAEGWSLPSFNATALGKWSVVTNCTAHKDWANDKNCVLVEPTGKISSVDGVFFREGQPFNQGYFYNISQESMSDGMDRALKFAKSENIEGFKLQEKFTYEKTIDKILNTINK
jgi:hypothetical protein